MAKENIALDIIEEGVNVEAETEAFGCCWTVYVWYSYI